MKMKRAKKSGQLLHTTRDVSTRRPMHITKRVRKDVPRLRRQEVLDYFRELVKAARERGVHTFAWVIQDDHLHWYARPESKEALADATRYVFGQLAKFIAQSFGSQGRKGKVFEERYYSPPISSECSRSVKQAFVTLNYVLKNVVARGYRVPDGGIDRYTRFCEDEIGADTFLRSVVGPTPRVRRSLLVRMTRGPVPWSPLLERLQPALPGT